MATDSRGNALVRPETQPLAPSRKASSATSSRPAINVKRLPKRLKMSVKRLGGTKPLLLRSGSKIGTATSKTSGFVFTAARGSGAFTARAVFGKTALAKGKTYVVTLVATAPDGRKSTLTVRFKG